MKKLFALLAVFGMLSFGAYAQDEEATESEDVATEEVTSENESDANASEASVAEAKEEVAAAPAAVAAEEQTLHQALKQKFIEGGAGFMACVVLCLILGLAIAIERIIYLNLASTVDSDKLLNKVDELLSANDLEGAKQLCRDTRGPVASIYYQGLDRASEGLDMAEKAVESYGSVKMGELESGLSWISLFIALGPSLGFLGTVIGMIGAFDAIEVAGDISPTLVAGGIKVALITTVGGLIVAMILQVFYNYLLAKIEGITNDMEESSIKLIDLLVEKGMQK